MDPRQQFTQQDAYSQSSYESRPPTSYSDTGFRPYHSQNDAYAQQQHHHVTNSVSPPPPEQTDRYPAPGTHPSSRPPSGMGERSQSYDGTSKVTTPGGQASSTTAAKKNDSVVIKVGMVGDAQIGKTSLMVKYVEGSWDEDYIQTLGVNFMEKTVSIRNTEITFSIWDLGGQREFVNMLPLVCNDAVAILFMFDLTRKSTLNSIKEWYRQGRGFNKTAIPFLVGTKYDHFVSFPREEQEEISNQVSWSVTMILLAYSYVHMVLLSIVDMQSAPRNLVLTRHFLHRHAALQKQ